MNILYLVLRGDIIIKDFPFILKCSCGKEMSGFVREDNKSDKLHCTCGLVWEVNKPYKDI